MQIISLPYAPDPDPLFRRIAHEEGAVLLHSGDRRHYQSRFDIFSARPRHVLTAQGPQLRVDGTPVAGGDVLTQLESVLDAAPIDATAAPDAPFTAGIIGLLGYPVHQYLERHRPAPRPPTPLPDVLGGYYDWSVVTDHYKRSTTLYSHRSSSDTKSLLRTLSDKSADTRAVRGFSGAIDDFKPSSSDAHYASAFSKIQRYISAGDCYQTNLARHYKARVNAEEGYALYRHLHTIQGGAFSAYMNFAAGAVLSLSPERLALRTPRSKGSRVETCPIKGTARRSVDRIEDAALARALEQSAKNRAENLMIVDLLRNDLGRLATTGSVRVRRLFEVITLPNVHHLVSTISADFGPDVSAFALLRALLPGGSITGAPKVRAVDIINEVEAVGRSAYCGSIGYIDHSGRMDMNIAIRSLVLDPDGALHLWGGGAIVADSDLNSERREIDHKVGALMRALSRSER